MKNLTLLELIENLSKLKIDNDFSIVAETLDLGKEYKNRDILSSFKNEIDAERTSLINTFKEFYFKKSNYTEFDQNGLSPAEIFEIIENYRVKFERLYMIYLPEYSQTITKNSKDEEYDMVKINWINEDGKKARILSKTYGKKGEAGLKFILPKLISDYMEGTEIPALEIKIMNDNRNLRPDFVVKIKGEIWGIDIKKTKKNDFIKTAVRLELWERYKEIYF